MKTSEMRRRIAHEAARMIAEDGGMDYGFAKRKAARQLGAPDSRHLPDNREIEEALRSYQALYQNQEQQDRLSMLRQVAVEYMELLEDFDPHLTGAVLSGTAGRHSEIDLQLFTDSSKELEFFLMGRQLAYRHSETRTDGQYYPRYSLEDPRAAVELTIYPAAELRHMRRLQSDGTPRRARLDQVRALLQG
jgi:predicted nucleotidyltransferase